MARKIFILFTTLLIIILIEKPWPTEPELFTAPHIPLENSLTDYTSQLLPSYKHHPIGDIKSNGYLYFYHSHRKNEHGHFHIFIANEKIFSHLIAISINESGEPQAFFTTNKWVTGEKPLKKKELLRALHNFHLSDDNPTNTYLNTLIKTYEPHLTQMLAAKPKGRRHQEILQLMKLNS